MKRSICFILPHFHLEYNGGAETQCYYLAQELVSRGWDVHYIRESNKPGSQKMDGIMVHGIPKRKNYMKWRNYFALKKVMKEIKADYWYNRATVSYLFMIRMFARKIGGKVAFAFSRDSQFEYDGDRQNRSKLHLRIFYFLDQFFFFKTLKGTDKILVQTKKQQQLLENNLKLDGHQIYNAHPVSVNGTPILRQKTILWIGRIRPFKHPHRFLEIAKHLSHTPYKFVLIGELKNNAFSDSVQEAASKLPNVELLGHQPPETVHELLLSSRLLINSSDFEGFSNTFIEAWLRGTPVVSVKVDPDNMIQDNDLGIVNEDLAEFSKEIEQLVENEDRWSETSDRCKEFAKNMFNIQTAVDRLEKVLR